jgi:UTP-glucose-1-phosphate uridylyltransferase
MKQVDPFGPSGETITDYSIYDAMKAGFNRIVFVISPKMEDDFKAHYVKKFPAELEVDYVIQAVDNIPAGLTLPAERVKPWGTAHAVMMAKDAIREPFAVINADDYYGRQSYQIMHDFLVRTSEDVPGQYCMVGFQLKRTVSEHGSVARGICQVNDHGFLTGMVERTKIFVENGNILFEEADGEKQELDPMSTVSMNLFGFTPDFFHHLDEHFASFIVENLDNPKAEFFIPLAVDRLINNGSARMSVLQTPESWFGVTYKEDKPKVLKAIRDLVDGGVYPTPLWER